MTTHFPAALLRTAHGLAGSLLCLLVLTTVAPAPAAADPLTIYVSILPQAGFVQEIGGPDVRVEVLVGPGHSPATYEPTPRQMADLAGAALFLGAGVPFERGLLPKIKSLRDGPRVAGPYPADVVHLGHDHVHDDNWDPHTWLDPQQAQALADTVCAQLSLLRPDQVNDYIARRDGLQQRLQVLDTDLKDILAPYQGAEFFVFHPAYGHFAARYGLQQIAVEAGGHEPGARQLAQVIERARAAGAQVIVVQPQFSRRSAQAVAQATGAEILVLDPLAADYEANLRHIGAALASALGSRP